MTELHSEQRSNGVTPQHQHNGENELNPPLHAETSVLIIGGGVVGCLTAYKLGQAGISTTIIERLPDTSTAPRACGYFGSVQLMLDECGLYKHIRNAGFVTRGLCFRKSPKDDEQGGKLLGDVLANVPLCAPNDFELGPGSGVLNLPQAQMNKLFMQEALKTGLVKVDFNTEIVSIPSNTDNGVHVLTRNVQTNVEKTYKAQYAIATDGAKSATRKALKLPFPGHTWPELLIATNVMMRNVEETPMHTHFVMHPVYWSVSTPLSDPVMGENSLWRFTMAADPALDHLAYEDLLSDENIFEHYERCLPGPRPLEKHIEIVARAVYKTHQRLVPAMRKGNVLLAGDAAHCNHPFGALGLNTGMLDADAAATALTMILNPSALSTTNSCVDLHVQYPPAHILNTYSDARRKVFQTFVDPTSTQNKLRAHSYPDLDSAVEDDWFLRELKLQETKPSMARAQKLMKPYIEGWRTDMLQEVKEGWD